MNHNSACVREVPKDGWFVVQVQAQTSSWPNGGNNALFQGRSSKGICMSCNTSEPKWAKIGVLYRPYFHHRHDSEDMFE
eukprot:3562765-Lingulodinium_polyedra.AAC.1